MTILGYILTIFNYIFYCGSRFCKEKKNMLILDIFAKIATILSFICFKSTTGAMVMILSITLLVVARYKEKKELSKFTLITIYALYIMAYICNMLFTYTGIASILVSLTAFITLTSIWWFNPQNMRKAGIITSIIYTIYQISIKNWSGLLEILVIIANILSYKKYKKQNEESSIDI